MTDDSLLQVSRRAHRALETLHSMIYFAPEADEEYAAIGLRPGRMGYFASRSAPMGAVSPGVTAATFYSFNPTLVARHIPRAWTLAATDDILAARLRAADRALRRLLGDDVLGGPEVAEAAELARAATGDLRPDGRPLFAGHAQLDWPGAAHLVLWHAISLLREYRGDGHVAALVAGDLTGLDALVTHTATGQGFTVEAAKATRGWSDEQWAGAVGSLRERGLLDGNGLTEAGQATRDAVEGETDRLAVAPWRSLGQERTVRLTELGAGSEPYRGQGGRVPARDVRCVALRSTGRQAGRSFPLRLTRGSVQADRSKQHGRRLPLSSLLMPTSTRRCRVAGFAVAPIQRTHSQRAIGVMSSHVSRIDSGASASAAARSSGTVGSGQSGRGTRQISTSSPARPSSSLIQCPRCPSGSITVSKSSPSTVPRTATCPRDGSAALAPSGRRTRIVDPMLDTVALNSTFSTAARLTAS